MTRYSRQIRFPQIGEAGQRLLGEASAVLIGCGALGSVIANTLVRAGLGHLRIIDRDFVEISNLQRQVLYTEADVDERLPKAIAAANHLRAVNSEVTIEPIVADVTPGNIESFCQQAQVILDGSDNFEIRFLINDVAIKSSTPWIYGGCLGAEGQTMTILPGESACLNCLMLDGPPPPGTSATCDSFGILSPIINLIASIEAMEAIKLLSGNRDAVSTKLQIFSLWNNDSRQMDLSNLRGNVDCPTCKGNELRWLTGKEGTQATVLCGRNSVQLRFPDRGEVDLGQIAHRLEPVVQVKANEYLLRFQHDQYELTLFADGRAIVSGTDEPSIARKLYAQFIGQ